MVFSLSTPAEAGFANASLYDKHRPSYPTEAVEQLLSALHLAGKPGAKVLDLAAGTGKFTELLAARPEGFNIVAVEPHGEMRAELEKKALRGVNVLDGSATAIPLPPHSIDAVIAAQAFHWFATRDALEEIHRIIKPGGHFGVIWNIENYNAPQSWTPRTQWEANLKSIIWRHDDDHPRFRHSVWRNVLEDENKQPVLFSQPLEEGWVPFTKHLPPSAIWDRFHTLSQIAVLQGKELEDTKAEVETILESEDVETNEEGKVVLHGQTYFAWTNALSRNAD